MLIVIVGKEHHRRIDHEFVIFVLDEKDLKNGSNKKMYSIAETWYVLL